jgi:dihydroorotase
MFTPATSTPRGLAAAAGCCRRSLSVHHHHHQARPLSAAAAATATAATAPPPFPPAEPLPNAAPPLPAGTRIVLPTPDDWHLHLRDGAAMASVAPHTAMHFKRAVVMPNLSPQPVTTVAAAREYRARIGAALERAAQGVERGEEEGGGSGGVGLVALSGGASSSSPQSVAARLRAFEPLMTLYLTDATPVSEVEAAAEASAEAAAAAAAGNGGGGGGGGGGGNAPPVSIAAFKLYPAGATTNSSQGVTGDLSKALPAIRAMAKSGIPLCVHGEVTRGEVDVFDREAFFLRERLAPLLDAVPDLRVVLEHITTEDAAEFVLKHGSGGRIAATVTPQHMLLNRNALLVGGVRPHAYCLPVLKRERHRAAVLRAATLPASEGGGRFFLGTDSAPHPKHAKECACGCAGVYSAPAALALYAHAFEQAGALEDGRFAAFCSRNGAAFYRRPVNQGTVALVKKQQGSGWRVPESFEFGEGTVVPMWAGQELSWCVEEVKA